MELYYTLDGHTPRPCSMEEAKQTLRDTDRRRVGFDRVGPWEVSTVFLALDHQFGAGPPMLFETMVFKGDDRNDLYAARYSTWEAAEAGHQAVVRRLMAGEAPADL